MGLRFRVGLRSLGFVFEGCSFRKTLTRLVMATSVRFTGVLGQNEYFMYISSKFFSLLNLIDHAVDLKQSVRDPRKHCAIDHLFSHGYNFEGVFVFSGVFVFEGSSFSRGLRLRLYLIFVCVIKRTAFKAYNTITESP